jgi:hypothetical protein
MADWQIIQSDDFTELPPETPAATWRQRGWGLLAAGLGLALALGGVWSLWQQWSESRTALADDLNATIFAEETNRWRGRSNPAPYQTDAPAPWRRAYRRTFEARPPGISQTAAGLKQAGVTLASIDDFDGRCALVTLANAPHDPVRAYCLAETGWLRTPIPVAAWGDEAELEPAGGLRLRFRERDRVFAEELAAELAGLAGQLPLAGLEVVLEPHDLASPLILAEAGHIVLNSPEVVPTTTGARAGPETSSAWPGLSGPETIRLALGRVLVSRSARFRPPPTPRLPGAGRFTTAAQTVTAMRLLLDPQAQERLRQSWRTNLAGGWVSPFFAGLLTQPSRLSAGQAEAAALLTADYIYHHHGPEALPHLLARLPRAASWNQVFGSLPLHSTLPAVSGQAFSPSTTLRGASEQSYSTLLLEIEVAHYAGAAQTAITGLYRAYSRPLDRPPLTARLRYLDNRSQGQTTRYPFPRFFFGSTPVLFNWPYRDDRLENWRLYVTQPDRVEPLLVETSPDLALTTPDGLPLSPGCLGPGAELAIEGDWLEAPHRFQASRLTVQDAPRLALSPAPANSLAYLVLYRQRPAEAGQTPVEPGQAETSEGSAERGAASQLVALQADGSLRPLLDLNARLQLFPLPLAEDEPAHFLIQSDAPHCRRSWLGHYEPARGLTAHWFAPAAPVEWLWRYDQAEPLFVKSENSRRYQFYKAGGTEAFQWQNFSTYSFTFMGWQPASRQLVAIGYRTYGTILGLLDPAGSQLTWLASPPAHALKTLGLSPAGDWLAYPTGLPSLFGPSSRVYFLHLEQPGPPSSLRLEAGNSLASLAWSPYLDQAALAVLAGPIASDYTIRPSQLLRVDPTRPEEYVKVAQAGPGEQFASPIFCRSGALLYVVEQAGRYELRRQQPGHPAKTLLHLDQPFRPLACGNEQ